MALGPGLEVMDEPGLGTGVADPVDAAAVARGGASAAVRGAEGRPADATPLEIRS